MSTLTLQPSSLDTVFEGPTTRVDERLNNPVTVQTTGQLTVAVTPSSAFQVINPDNLSQIAKPNAIVRPVRRAEPISGQKSITEDLSKKSHELQKFAHELDFRLRQLKKDKKLEKVQSKNGSNQDLIVKRPLFITTVPTGVFLQPIKDPPQLSKRVYAFSSRPRVFTNRNAVKDNRNQIGRVDKELTAAINGIRAFTHNFIAANPSRNREQGSEPYKNLMFERRVVRGSNFCQSNLLAQGDSTLITKDSEARRRQLLRKRCLARNQRNVLGTPPPVYGRKHEDVQTEKYLEELFERPPECDANVQTDLFLQKPPSPPYIPAKIGVDVATEILEGELFDFDNEVKPILETLVEQSIEQGLLEVIHEEEMAAFQEERERFNNLRAVEMAEIRRLEEEEIRLEAEKARRIRQDEIARELDEKMQQRITAAKLIQGHIANLLPDVLSGLESASDAASKDEIQKYLCPLITEEVSEEIGKLISSRAVLTEILKDIVVERAANYAGYKETVEETGDTVGAEQQESELTDIISREEI